MEARFLPSKRFNITTGVEGVYDHESLLEPERINRATDQIVGATGAPDRRFNFHNLGAFASSNVQAQNVRLLVLLHGAVKQRALQGEIAAIRKMPTAAAKTLGVDSWR